MNKKFLVIALVILLVVSMLTSIVSASSLSASMTASKTTVPEMTEFTVTIKVSNIDAGVNGINSIEGILSYDTSVFEALTTSSIDQMNEWTVNYTADTGKLILYKPSWEKNDTEVAQITLKTKKGTSGKTGDIKYTNIKASDSESMIDVSDISTKITVGTVKDNENMGNTSNTNTNKAQQIPMNTSNKNTNKPNNNTNKYVNSNKVNNTNNTNTTIEEDIPYTGTSDNIMRAIFVVLVVAGVSYFKYESIKDN